MKIENNLIAPTNYWIYKASKIFNNTNHCGVRGITNNIVSDKLLGLNISRACHIHDYMYSLGKNKKEADFIFLRNMKLLINKKTKSKILKSLREAKAYFYYLAVKIFGGFFFESSLKTTKET